MEAPNLPRYGVELVQVVQVQSLPPPVDEVGQGVQDRRRPKLQLQAVLRSGGTQVQLANPVVFAMSFQRL